LISKPLIIAAGIVAVIGLVAAFTLMQTSEPAPEVMEEKPEEVMDEKPEVGGSDFSISDPDPLDINCRGAKLLAQEDGGQMISIFKLKDGECYQVEQFSPISFPDVCTETHYHHELFSLNGVRRADTPTCGAAVASDIIGSAAIWITPSQFNDMNNFILGRVLSE